MNPRALAVTSLLALGLAACGPDYVQQPIDSSQSALTNDDGGSTCTPTEDGGCCVVVVVVEAPPDAGDSAQNPEPSPTPDPSTDPNELSGSGCGSAGAGLGLMPLLLLGLAFARRRRMLALGLVLTAGTAQAQAVKGQGFALDRFDPAPRNSGWFQADDLQIEGPFQPTLGLTLDYGDAPLVVRSRATGEATPIVSGQLMGHFGASFVFADRVRVGTSLPVALDSATAAGGVEAAHYDPRSGISPGDMRLDADVRLFGHASGPLTAALGARLYVPTGSPEAFTGDGHARAGLRAAVAGALGSIRYAVGVTGLARTSDAIPLGSGALIDAAIGWQSAGGMVRVGPELYAALDRASDSMIATASAPAAEALLGAHVQLGALRVGLGAGPGLTQGIGTPRWRALASIDWAPAPEQPAIRDTDDDGIVDSRDACPEVRGEPDPDPARNGCPHPPPDRDGDGIPDAKDACPDKAGPQSSDAAKNGCPLPPPDRDRDGVPDAQDACPDQPGLMDGDPKLNGCPPPDRDGDGVPDAQDECPDQKGNPELMGCPGSDRDGDGVPDRLDNCPARPGPGSNQGCPASEPQHVALTREKLVLREPVKFAPGTARLDPASESLLDQVAQVLNAHPEIVAVIVEGHADERASAIDNQRLSLARAQAVVQHLVKRGVARTRLQARGYGAAGASDAHLASDRIELRIFATVR